MKLLFSLLFVVVNLYSKSLLVGAENAQAYGSMLQGKNIAMVVNHSSMVGKNHLVDLFVQRGVKVKTIFAPEHGFRGKADAGEHIEDGVDKKSGVKIVSLYGKHKKPSQKDLKGVELIVFDIQDVGVRFYTYLSTLHYVMEAAAENDIRVIVLDRPNPNASRIDGPMLHKEFSSFVGLHTVPLLYGMTIGEYALMINGQGWLKDGVKADLEVIPLQNYTHNTFYHLPIKPSPNLPNDLSIVLYPSLALFEGTVISAGRGTLKQFQLYGAPKYGKKAFSFIPKPREGAQFPKHKGKRCYGVDLSKLSLTEARRLKEMDLSYLLDAYSSYNAKEKFFLKNGFIDRLAGSDVLRKQIIANKSEKEIRQSWQTGLIEFKKIRQKYLLYP